MTLPIDSTTAIAVSSPEDTVLAPPLMLGYWPGGSICAVAIDHDDQITVIMRWDRETAAGLPPATAGLARRVAACHLVAYADATPGAAMDPASLLRALATVEAAGLPLGRVLVAGRDPRGVAWSSLEDAVAGQAWTVTTSHQVAHVASVWGCAAWEDSRDAYVSDIDPDPGVREQVERAMGHIVSADLDRDALITRVRDLVTSDRLEPETVAEVLVGLQDVRVRDTLLWDVMHEEPVMWQRAAQRLAEVVAAAPDTHVAAPATVLAILRWQTGDGSRAVAAVERARRAAPDYTLADLVDRCLAGGMHPEVWRDGLASLRREACLRAA